MMNERIETPAKAAGYDMINKAAMRALGFDVEKFTESIVQECISLCEEVDDINKTYDTEFGPKECIKVIKTYFGVEE